MAFIVINRVDKRELRRVADALERIADYLRPLEPPDTEVEFVTIDKQKRQTPEDEVMPESARM